MAAPTDVRVEAESISTVRLRWTYSGAAAISVHRSTNGTDYTEITDVTNRVVPGTTEYEDQELDAATKYWYKLSDDAGSTFSSVVTVYTHACPIPGDSSDVVLPRAVGEVTETEFNELATIVENRLTKFVSPDGKSCVACISDGALVLDCLIYEDCESIEVEVDQEVNSISIPNCEDREVNIDFIIPPGATRGICGWPRGIGFTGDECFRAPVSGGSASGSGRTINEFIQRGLNTNQASGKSRPRTATKGTRGGGQSRSSGAGCTCTPGSNGELTIKVCNPSGSNNPNNSLNCQAATQGANLIVCGGKGPYTFSNTGDISVTPGADGNNARVAPPANAGSGESGTAYTRGLFGIPQGHSSGTTHAVGSVWALYGCDDALIECNNAEGGTITVCAYIDAAPDCQTHSGHPTSGSGGVCDTVSCGTICTDECDCAGANGSLQDRRSAGMISAGCNPCGLQAGATVTVTDALGAQTTVILRG